ncbi:TPA: hypothetical protein QDB28_004025 [Burkholderia vietnamiensis]|nr:hypothetical protein [Burkholderia vietnamiensis]
MKKVFDWAFGMFAAALLLLDVLYAVQAFDAGHYGKGAMWVAFVLFWLGYLAVEFPPRQGSLRERLRQRASNYVLYRYGIFVVAIYVTILSFPSRLVMDISVGAAAGVFYASKRTWLELRDIFAVARSLERRWRAAADPNEAHAV